MKHAFDMLEENIEIEIVQGLLSKSEPPILEKPQDVLSLDPNIIIVG
jgi:hypothetical protein